MSPRKHNHRVELVGIKKDLVSERHFPEEETGPVPPDPTEWVGPGTDVSEEDQPLNGRGSVPCSVYRFFNEAGDLLYVGITRLGYKRIEQHAKDKNWFLEVHTATFQHFPTVWQAQEAEAIAIHEEKPAYNKQIPMLPPPPLSPEELERLRLNRTRGVKGVAEPGPPPKPGTPGYWGIIAPSETMELLDKQTRKWFKMSAQQFIEAWEAGEIAQDDKRMFYVANLLGSVRVKVHGS